MKQIYVAIEHAGKMLPVGVLRFDSQQGFGYFTYLAAYDGPPLDPVNLNYRSPVDPRDRLRRGERVFVVDAASNPGLMHQVFVDSMPGHWGMSVLQAEYPEIRQLKDAERLYWMGARTSGALRFFVKQLEDENPAKGLDQLEIVRKKSAEFVETLQKMGLEGVRNPAVASHGGAMPKASYEDANGNHWIAKFDRPNGLFQETVLEHAANEMAKRCGVTSPRTKILADGAGGHMFLTERYDRSASERFHKVSFFSLIGAKDLGSGDYKELFRVLKDVVDDLRWPQQRDELLRRMAFNIGMNVCDDHLRNHEMRLMPTGEWELSPAFDLVPFADASPHQCGIYGHARANINLDDERTVRLWSQIAADLKVTPQHVLGIVQGVATSIKEHWPGIVATVGFDAFNQQKALKAAEIGCAASFNSNAKSQEIVPLERKVLGELNDAGRVIKAAFDAISRNPLSTTNALALSQSLIRLSAEVPRWAHHLRGAGHQQAAEHLQGAPLKIAALAILEPGSQDDAAWRELVDASMSLEAVVAQSSPASRQTMKANPN